MLCKVSFFGDIRMKSADYIRATMVTSYVPLQYVSDYSTSGLPGGWCFTGTMLEWS